MLSRKNRLNLRLSQHRAVLRTGRRYSSHFLQAFYDRQGLIFQIGVIIPKRIIPQATTRNALRRKIMTALPVDLLTANELRLIIRPTDARATTLSPLELSQFFRGLTQEILHSKGHRS